MRWPAWRRSGPAAGSGARLSKFGSRVAPLQLAALSSVDSPFRPPFLEHALTAGYRDGPVAGSAAGRRLIPFVRLRRPSAPSRSGDRLQEPSGPLCQERVTTVGRTNRHKSFADAYSE